MKQKPIVMLGEVDPAPRPAPPAPAPRSRAAAPKPPATAPQAPAPRGLSTSIRAFLAGRRKLLVAGVALAVAMLAYIASLPTQPPEQITALELDENENRMISVPFDPASPPAAFRAGDAAVLEASVFMADRDRGQLHVLVTGVRRGRSRWSVVTADGICRTYDTEVRPSAPRPRRSDEDRALALQKLDEAARLEKDIEQDPANAYHAMVRCREGCEILLEVPYGGADALYVQTFGRFEESARRWASLYARAEGEFTLARIGGDAKAIRQALRALLQIAPDPRTAEYQRNATLLNHVYGRAAEEKKS